MMGVFAVLGILVVLGGGLLYVDRSATARLESERMAFALQVKTKSIAEVQARIKAERVETQKEIEELKQAAASIPEIEPLDDFCRPGCKTRWPASP